MSARNYAFLARAASCGLFVLVSQLGCSPKYELLRSVDAGGTDSGGFSSGGTGIAGGDAGGSFAVGGNDVGSGGTGVGGGGGNEAGGGGTGTGIGGIGVNAAGSGGRGSECTSNDECANNGICCECADASRVCLSTTGGAPVASCPQACASP